MIIKAPVYQLNYKIEGLTLADYFKLLDLMLGAVVRTSSVAGYSPPRMITIELVGSSNPDRHNRSQM